jgi:type 1 glutamine amidotransferase
MYLRLCLPLLTLFFAAQDAPLSVTYQGGTGLGNGKHIVLVSGDEEYRSEEALPQLGKILAQRHGFTCTVLFAVDPKTGLINPSASNIPGLEALQKADLMIIATRFRNLPDEQMKYIADYVESGKPIIGMRTATHAFSIPKGQTYSKYSHNYSGKDYPRGFGRQVLGETWVAHHGKHGAQSTRGIIAPGAQNNPILRGIKDGDIWGPTDVYTANPPSDSTILVLGQVLKGMKASDEPLEGPKNEPMMPIAWTRLYKGAEGKTARVFTTTMGSSTDLASEGVRRLLVNAVYWALGMEDRIPNSGTDVQLVGTFTPTPFGTGRAQKGLRPADLK